MLLIKLEEIAEVLLRDGWHRVLNRSLTVDTCQFGVRDKAGDKIPYWEDSVTWEEETSEGSKTLYRSLKIRIGGSKTLTLRVFSIGSYCHEVGKGLDEIRQTPPFRRNSYD